MMKDCVTMMDFGKKVLVRAKCVICNGEYVDTVRKDGKDKNKSFFCEMCEQERDLTA